MATARRALYDGLQLRTRWQLQETQASRTLAKVPVPRIFFHRGALARYREIHGFNFADPNDVLVADVGRGVQVAWFGLLQEHRLPLRAHSGYLLLKNGVPIGYGDASLLFDWAEIAFNIFETFRAGESAFAWSPRRRGIRTESASRRWPIHWA